MKGGYRTIVGNGSYWFGLLVTVFALKALGGSFHRAFRQLGFVEFHGPILGAIICVALTALFLMVANTDELKRPPNKTKLPTWFWVIGLATGLLGIFYRLSQLVTFPIDASRADMLPNVLAGFLDLENGISPFRSHTLSTGVVIPHYYLPALWVGFWPFYKFGLDIRLWTVICQVATWIILIIEFSSRSGARWKTLAFLFLLASLGFSKLLVWHCVDVHTGSIGLFLVLLLYLLDRERWGWAGVVAAVLVFSREPAILLVVPLLIVLFRRENTWPFYFGFVALIGVGIAVFWNEGHLFDGLRHYAALTNSVSEQQAMGHFGMNGLLRRLDLVPMRYVILIAALAAPLMIVVRKKAITPLGAIYLGAISYLWVMGLAAVSFEYVYIEMVLLGGYWVALGPGLLRVSRPGSPPIQKLQTFWK